MADLNRTIDRSIRIARTVANLLQRRVRAANERFAERMRGACAQWTASGTAPKTPFEFWRQWSEYTLDATQRSVLYWDTLRQRGNQWLAHEAAGKPPVLKYRYEMIADARTYERPANHALVRIIPPKGVAVDDAKRPFVIVEEEIRWIVNNLFVGNKLSSGEARLGPRRYFDLKSIKQPIIVPAAKRKSARAAARA